MSNRKKEDDPTIADLIAALEQGQAETAPIPGLTTTQLMDRLQWGRKRVMRHLQILSEGGKVDCIWSRGKDITWRYVSVPVDRLKEETKKKV